MSDGPISEKAETKEPKKKKRQRWKGSRKQMTMPEAMRLVGLNEQEVAFQMDRLVTETVASSNDKVRFEIL
jgi:hypothetical protein